MSDLLEIKKEASKAMPNDDAYLTSFLCNLDSDETKPLWIVHYYDPINDTMYSYDLENKTVEGPLEVFKEQDFVPELDLDDVKTDFPESLDIARRSALPAKDFKKIVIILQTIESMPVWNITLLSSSFHALNVRIDARDGDVIKVEPVELFDFRGKE